MSTERSTGTNPGTTAGAATDLQAATARIVDDLTYKFDGVFPADTIADAVNTASHALATTARVTDYLPVLIERFATERLRAAAQAEGRLVKTVPELLFVCVHNAGRSQMAAALAEHLSGGRVHVRCAGSKPADQLNPLAVTVLAERGIDLSQAYPKPLTDDVVRAADVIITMGCGDACPVYPGKRYEDWDVPDPAGATLDQVRLIREDLQTRVSNMLRELGI
jgi:protein-tyrosine-phosphatase